NYASFCKSLSVSDVSCNLRKLLNEKQLISSQNLDIALQEIFKLLMSQISSLRDLVFFDTPLTQNTTFISYPGARDCLKDLSELHCYSDICPEFFYQLFQICHNI